MPDTRSLQVAVGTLAVAVFVALACTDGPTSQGVSMESRQSSPAPTLTPQTSGTTQRFFAVSPVNDKVVWASAAGGTFARTTNGGQTWVSRIVPGAEALQFRDVEGVSEKVAYLLSAGEGADNRIYKTEDGGWNVDAAVPGRPRPPVLLRLLRFLDPGPGDHLRRRAWMAASRSSRPPTEKPGETSASPAAAQAGEAGFAASGTCIKTHGGNRAWIGTGGGAMARILATTNGGSSWTSHDVPILQGTPTSGVVSVDFRDPNHGILGGGDVVASTVPQNNVARSSDGGHTWIQATSTPFNGAVYGLSYVPSLRRTVVATGPSGAAWSSNEGDSLVVAARRIELLGGRLRQPGHRVAGRRRRHDSQNRVLSR